MTDIAALLLADPTYSLMSPAERRGEALELMKTAGLDDDPLDAAAAVEEADERLAAGGMPEAPSTAPLPFGREPCREKWGDGCTKPIAATGRCMECGARRQQPDGDGVSKAWPEPEAVAPVVAPEPTPAQDVSVSWRLPAPGFLARFKATSGNSDKLIGDMLGRARSSVQAVVGGRIGDNLTPADLEKLDAAIAGQLYALTKLRAEIRG